MKIHTGPAVSLISLIQNLTKRFAGKVFAKIEQEQTSQGDKWTKRTKKTTLILPPTPLEISNLIGWNLLFLRTTLTVIPALELISRHSHFAHCKESPVSVHWSGTTEKVFRREPVYSSWFGWRSKLCCFFLWLINIKKGERQNVLVSERLGIVAHGRSTTSHESGTETVIKHDLLLINKSNI